MDTLLDSGKYSDLTLHCQEKTWKVHRALLCTSSAVFATMVDSGFKEGQSQEINLRADEPTIVEKMLRFIYQGDYNDERDMDKLSSDESVQKVQQNARLTSFTPQPLPIESAFSFGSAFNDPQKPKWSEKSLLINVQVYIIAEKFDIGALKKLAMERYVEVVERFWDTTSFTASAKLLYNNTPQSDRLLRDVIAETAKKNILALIDKKEFEEAMVNHGDLAVDVLKLVLLKEEEVEFETTFTSKKSKKKLSRGYN